RAGKVVLGIGTFGEESGGFDNYVRADGSPVDLAGILDLEYFDRLAINRNGVFGMGDLVVQIAEDGVVFEKVREGFGICDVVDGDKLNVLVVDGGAHNVAADPAEAIDANFNGHSLPPSDVTQTAALVD